MSSSGRACRSTRIAIRDRPEDVAAFLARHGDPFDRIGADRESRVQMALGSSGVPESFVVDGRGIIRYQHMGPIEPGRRAGDPCAQWEAATMKRLLLLLAAASLPRRLLADSDLPAARWANGQLPDPRQEAQARALMEELRCLVCQGQSIADQRCRAGRRHARPGARSGSPPAKSPSASAPG